MCSRPRRWPSAARRSLRSASRSRPRCAASNRAAKRGLRDDTRQIAAALRRRSDVRSADLNYVRTATAVPTDVFYPRQWHYDQINLPQAWDITDPDSGVVVAVVDTGVKLAHPDLAGQLVTGYDFIFDIADRERRRRLRRRSR